MNDPIIPILLFSSRRDVTSKEIERCLGRLGPGTENIICSEPEHFSDEILQILSGMGIILILIRDKKELDRILQLHPILSSHDIILILSEGDSETMQKGLDLYPRYISYVKEEYSDVFQVIEKMMIKIKIKRGEKNAR